MYRSLLDLKFVSSRWGIGKSVPGSLRPHPSEMKSLVPRYQIMIQSTLPRKVSKLMNTKSVPQTNTGDQVE